MIRPSTIKRVAVFASAFAIATAAGCASVKDGIYGKPMIPVKTPDGQAERDKFERLLAEERRERESRIEMASITDCP